MPCPASRYQSPAGLTPAFCQSASSFLLVPESSPRDTNIARDVAILASASAASLLCATAAGSAGGPMMTKSLYITWRRFTPQPSSTNFCSAAGACTSTTSTSPLQPSRNACPVPTASTWTSRPLRDSNFGRITFSKPEFSVLVVVAMRNTGGSACTLRLPRHSHTSKKPGSARFITEPPCVQWLMNRRVRHLQQYAVSQ